MPRCASSSCGGDDAKRSRAERFESRRSWSSYVARMPCRSIAFETRFARCVNTRFMREEKVVVCLCMFVRGGGRGDLPYRRSR